MKIGTRSLLFGAHQVLIHPWFVALAWWKLYGFPWDPRLWLLFVVHDWGYWGKPNMDGEEGERHPYLGAVIIHRLCDRKPDPKCPVCCGCIDYPPEGGGWIGRCGRCYQRAFGWYDMALYHSRFLAKQNGKPVSKFCYADKLSICLMPFWLYLPLVWLTGELKEYMSRSENKEGAKYKHMVNYASAPRQWFENMRMYLRRWVDENKDGGTTDWTPIFAAPCRICGAAPGEPCDAGLHS